MNFKQKAQELFAAADVKINGSRPWDIQVHNEKLYRRTLIQGTLGFGESYMDGWWDCQQIDQFIDRALRADIYEKIRKRPALIFLGAISLLSNQQSILRAFKVGEQHYDVGNDLYRLMLDKRMVYSCGYWKNARNLEQAQEAKLDLTCKKLKLKPGMTLLDIGCGWGSLVKYAAEKYKVRCLGITISKEQAILAREMCNGLPIEIRITDYRALTEKFDRIVSVGMFEHVGRKNYRTYMKVVNRCLKNDGLFLLHTIGRIKSVVTGDPWMSKYIFTSSMLPSIKQIARSAEGLFVIEDLHNIGFDYDMTLMAWYANFIKGWDKIKHNYNDRFFRMWKFYLLLCAGMFRSRQQQVWQIVLSKKGSPGGYERVT